MPQQEHKGERGIEPTGLLSRPCSVSICRWFVRWVVGCRAWVHPYRIPTFSRPPHARDVNLVQLRLNRTGVSSMLLIVCLLYLGAHLFCNSPDMRYVVPHLITFGWLELHAADSGVTQAGCPPFRDPPNARGVTPSHLNFNMSVAFRLLPIVSSLWQCPPFRDIPNVRNATRPDIDACVFQWHEGLLT